MRELGDKQGIGRLLNNLGIVAKNQGDYTAARAFYEESLAIKQELGDKPGIARSLGNLGPLACEQGHYREAYAYLAECLRLCRELGDKPDTVSAIEGMALLATAQAQPERAVRLWGAAVGLREAIGSPVLLPEWEEDERGLAALRETLGEEAFTAAWKEGRTMPLEETIAFALGKPEG